MHTLAPINLNNVFTIFLEFCYMTSDTLCIEPSKTWFEGTSVRRYIVCVARTLRYWIGALIQTKIENFGSYVTNFLINLISIISLASTISSPCCQVQIIEVLPIFHMLLWYLGPSLVSTSASFSLCLQH